MDSIEVLRHDEEGTGVGYQCESPPKEAMYDIELFEVNRCVYRLMDGGNKHNGGDVREFEGGESGGGVHAHLQRALPIR